MSSRREQRRRPGSDVVDAYPRISEACRAALHSVVGELWSDIFARTVAEDLAIYDRRAGLPVWTPRSGWTAKTLARQLLNPARPCLEAHVHKIRRSMARVHLGGYDDPNIGGPGTARWIKMWDFLYAQDMDGKVIDRAAAEAQAMAAVPGDRGGDRRFGEA